MKLIRADRDEYNIVEQLLTTAGLSAADLQPEMLDYFVVGKNGESLAVVGGFEWYDTVALLRSIAVAPEMQKLGLGGQIVSELEGWMKEVGVKEIYLLTETAVSFFSQQGYQIVDRSLVPKSILRSAQFSILCPDSASCMVKEIG